MNGAIVISLIVISEAFSHELGQHVQIQKQVLEPTSSTLSTGIGPVSTSPARVNLADVLDSIVLNADFAASLPGELLDSAQVRYHWQCIIDGMLLDANSTGICTNAGISNAKELHCKCNIPRTALTPGSHVVVGYAMLLGSIVHEPWISASVPFRLQVDAGTSSGADVVHTTRPHGIKAGGFKAGAYYTTYLNPIAQGLQNISRAAQQRGLPAGRGPLSIEDILRSDSDTVGDFYQRWFQSPAADGVIYGPLSSAANNSMYMHEPELGYYCLYRRRVGEGGYMADCPNITQTLTQHASWMRQAGLEYAVQDGTNWGAWPSSASDVYQLRSAEVVAEEWAALRKRGVITPDWGIWNAVNGDWTLWQQYLDRLYNEPAFETLMHKDAAGKKVFWVVNAARSPKPISIYDSQDESTPVRDDKSLLINETSVRALASNGGRDDITVQFAWDDTPVPSWWNGTGSGKDSWAYLGQCQDANVQVQVPCLDPVINDTALGSVLVVNSNNALDSLPFGASGKRAGLTLKAEFATAFEQAVDYIFLPSWNEYVVTWQRMPWDISSPYLDAIGLKLNDTFRNSIFVDGWGEAKSRTLEPSKQDNGLYLEVLSSCIRVARLAEAGVDWRVGITAGIPYGQGCSVQGELCCEHGSLEHLVVVWSMQKDPPTTGDPQKRVQQAALTGRPQEVRAIEQRPGWEQVCSPYGAYGGVCANNSVYWNEPYFQGARGPFLLLSNETEPETFPFESVGIVRCSSNVSAGAKAYSFGIEGAEGELGCGSGYDKIDYLLGYAALNRGAGSKMPRQLRKCRSVAAAGGGGGGGVLAQYYHTLDATCQADDATVGTVGFVF